MGEEIHDYVEAIRKARERLSWSQTRLSSEMRMGMSWASMIESRQRGIDIDRLPVLAEKLGLNKESFIRSYMHAKHVDVYRSLFPNADFAPRVYDAEPGSAIQDVAYRLSCLPRELRSSIEGTILASYDLAQRTDGHSSGS